MKTKRKSRFWIVFRNTLLIILSAIVIWVVFSKLMTIYEQKRYSALGQLVEVEGKKMHVYTKGKGDHTIVLLPGLGTAAPTLDFEPLIDELSKNNKVAVIEPFGYGWSDITNKDRTVQNIVNEIRIALRKAKINGPYILMPHSISGIYSMYYVNKYPEEVEAIVGIDATLPEATEYFHENAPKLPRFLSLVAPTGIARMVTYINPDDFLPIEDGGTYSEKNLKMTKAISAWKGYNKSVIDEANELEKNINKTVDMKFPSNMPILFFTTKNNKVTEDGKNNITFYKTQLTNSSISKIVTLKGHHYLHWTRYKEMSNRVNEFIKSLDED